jgi:hypothetical protein
MPFSHKAGNASPFRLDPVRMGAGFSWHTLVRPCLPPFLSLTYFLIKFCLNIKENKKKARLWSAGLGG